MNIDERACNEQLKLQKKCFSKKHCKNVHNFWNADFEERSRKMFLATPSFIWNWNRLWFECLQWILQNVLVQYFLNNLEKLKIKSLNYYSWNMNRMMTYFKLGHFKLFNPDKNKFSTTKWKFTSQKTKPSAENRRNFRARNLIIFGEIFFWKIVIWQLKLRKNNLNQWTSTRQLLMNE